MTPLILAVFFAVFDLTIERASRLAVAEQFAQVTLLPVIIGLGLQRFAPVVVARIRNPLGTVADALAKFTEHFDVAIFAAAGGMVSGHTIKHLLAALAIYWMLRMLGLRSRAGPAQV